MIKIRAIGVCFCLLLFATVAQLSAQTSGSYPRVDTSIDPTTGTVGDKFTMSISATVPDLTGLSALPLLEIDEESTWTLLSTNPARDAAADSNNKTRIYSYVIAPFETGQLPLPQVAITYSPADGSTSNTVLSEPLMVSIDSVIPGNSAGTNLRDVKRPVTLPLPKAVVYSGTALLLIMLAVIGWLVWRRYSERIKKMLGGPLRPDERALKEINQLESERLIEQKKLKEFYTRLSDAVREYLAAAYGVHATDLTSNEMLRALDELAAEQPLHHSQDFKTAMARLSELLDEADLVKFARLMPDASHCRRAMQFGRDVVALTRYRFEPEEPEKKASGGRPPQISPPPPPVQMTEAQVPSYREGRQ